MAHVKIEGPTDRREYEDWRRMKVVQIQPLAAQIQDCERAIVAEAIDLCAGNRQEAADRL